MYNSAPLETMLDIAFYLGLMEEISFYKNCLCCNDFTKIENMQDYDFNSCFLIIMHLSVILNYGEYGTSPNTGWLNDKNREFAIDYINAYLKKKLKE